MLAITKDVISFGTRALFWLYSTTGIISNCQKNVISRLTVALIIQQKMRWDTLCNHNATDAIVMLTNNYDTSPSRQLFSRKGNIVREKMSILFIFYLCIFHVYLHLHLFLSLDRLWSIAPVFQDLIARESTGEEIFFTQSTTWWWKISTSNT